MGKCKLDGRTCSPKSKYCSTEDKEYEHSLNETCKEFESE